MSDPVDLAKTTMEFVILVNRPHASITPPKLIAHMMSQIVFSIPNIPLVAKRSLTMAFSVTTAVDVASEVIVAAYDALM